MGTYDQWKLAAPSYWDNDDLDFRCDVCGEWAEECECEDGAVKAEVEP